MTRAASIAKWILIVILGMVQVAMASAIIMVWNDVKYNRVRIESNSYFVRYLDNEITDIIRHIDRLEENK